MRAAVTNELGSLDAIDLVETPDPAIAPGKLLVGVAATGLGFVDTLLALGRYQVKPTTPFVPGNEVAGYVKAIGVDVRGFAVGDPVIGTCFGGGLAERCLVDAAAAYPIPAGVAFDVAATLPINYATALHALQDRASLAAAETLLVLGAAGGTGTAAIEVGKRLGARVIACASSPTKRDWAMAAGADTVIGTDEPDWRKALRSLSGERGVDVVFDPTAGALFEPAFRSLAWGGRHLVIGFAAGAIPALPANLPLLKGAALIGVDLRQFGLFEPEKAQRNMRQLLDWVASGDLRVPVGERFTLDRARDALAAGMDRTSVGKTVVTIAR